MFYIPLNISAQDLKKELERIWKEETCQEPMHVARWVFSKGRYLNFETKEKQQALLTLRGRATKTLTKRKR
jgi:hypothetical protein